MARGAGTPKKRARGRGGVRVRRRAARTDASSASTGPTEVRGDTADAPSARNHEASDGRKPISGIAPVELDVGGHPALLLQPPGASALYVLAHGAGAGMRHAFMSSVAEALAARGIATLRWEFPYMAAGKPRPDRAEVAEAAVRDVWLAARAAFPDVPMFAGGMSFGGRMTSRSHAAQPLDGLRGVVFLSFPLHPPDQPGIERAEHLASAAGPLLFVQGDRDDFAPLRRLRPVVARLGARATLHVVGAADHGFHVQVRSGRTRDEVFDEIGDVVASWITIRAARG